MTEPVDDDQVGGTSADPNRLLTGAEVAALVHCSPATWRNYVMRGYAPEADEPGTGPVNRRLPQWRLSTIEQWLRTRPGKGNRTSKLRGDRK